MAQDLTGIGPVCLSATPRPLWRKMLTAAGALLSGRKPDQPCLLKSELLYALLSPLDPFGTYRVNLVVTFYCTGDRGHAWLSRNGRPLPASSSVDSHEKLTLIGETTKYRYLIKESNLRKWYDLDLPSCREANHENDNF